MVGNQKKKTLSDHIYNVYLSWYEHFIKVYPKLAEKYISEYCDANPATAQILHKRSVCKRKLANIGSALKDALKAEELVNNDPHISMAVCNCLYELNRFEDCIANLEINRQKYGSAVKNDFKDHIIVVEENFRDCLGDALDSFLCKNKNIFGALMENFKRRNFIETRPLWKIRRSQGECDVVSTNEEHEVLVSPIEKARRAHWYRIFAQIYFGKSWVDEVFLRNLVKKDKWIGSVCTGADVLLRKQLKPNYTIVNKFLRMLHARSPLYTEFLQKFGNQKFYKKNREQYLFIKQFHARRYMFTVLKTIKSYRELGKVETMARYIEKIMGDYVVLKSSRIMLWKFEFINEVYNTLGLAYADGYVVPKDIAYPQELSLRELFKVNTLGKVRHEGFVFGDRSTYVSSKTPEAALDEYKHFLSRLEKRLYFAKYSIEKCYLIYEMARASFKQNRFDECNVLARRAIEETKNCNSLLWKYLSLMLIVKTYTVLHKIEYCQNALMDALAVATNLKSPKILEFTNLAIAINTDNIQFKKSRVPGFDNRRRSKHSLSAQSLELYNNISSEHTSFTNFA